MSLKRSIATALLSSFLLLCLTSCEKIMGYGVLLWSLPEYGLPDGTVVPVYIKSNISQQFIIGIPETNEKIEVPLWQITDPLKKKKAEERAQRYLDYQHIYARVFLDGLPMRAEAVNTSKQVYRLRKDEVIKVLYKGKGQAVMSGQNAMEGEWLRVLAADGTSGWCFSYNLRLFDETEQDTGPIEVAVEDDPLFTALSEKLWYPENYAAMIKRQQVDLTRMTARTAFDAGVKSGTVRFDSEKIKVSYPYAGYTKSGTNVYKFTDTPIQVTVRNENLIVVQYSDERGMPTSINLSTLTEPIEKILQKETARRESLFLTLETLASQYTSTNYGSIRFVAPHTFVWTNNARLVPSLLGHNCGKRGTVKFEHFLSSSLASYDGAMSLTWDENKESHLFLYKIDNGGIRLEVADKATVRDNVIQSRAGDSLVMFFAFDEYVPEKDQDLFDDFADAGGQEGSGLRFGG